MSYQGVSLILDMIRLLAQALLKQRVHSLRRSEACRRNNNNHKQSLVSLVVNVTLLHFEAAPPARRNRHLAQLGLTANS